MSTHDRIFETDPPSSSTQNVHWDLSSLYPDERALLTALEQAQTAASEFSERFKGRIGSCSAAELREALECYERLVDQIGRAATYAYLNWSTNTNDAPRGALLQRVKEASRQVYQDSLFFDLEWIAMDDDRAQQRIDSPELRRFVHYLRLQRLMKPHVLSEAEERILVEKSVTGQSAWNRFFDEALGATRFPLGDKLLTEQEVLAKLHDRDRETRRKAAESMTKGLRERLRETTFVFNTLLSDKASTDRLRSYPHWLSSRNLSNQVSDKAVERLVESVSDRFGLVARFYGLKRRLLGLEVLYDYDRYAPVGQSETHYTWKEACEVVLTSYRRFHPKLAEIITRFYEERWIDAAVAPGKRGGAFSHGAVPSAHPFVLLNFTGRVRDVQTLAHELGHGVHQFLARKQGVLLCDAPLVTAETASVFGEMLVFENLLTAEQDERNQLAMLVAKIDDTIATVFRQIAMNRFEDRIHNARRKEGELSSDRFGEIWIETQSAMFQRSVTLGDHYRIWWSYIPHFVHTPGYVYAYAFGELLVLALFARYREEGKRFAPKYLDLLEAGGSDWPHQLVSRLGVDLLDPSFWQEGLKAIEGMIEKAENLAEKLGIGSSAESAESRGSVQLT